MNRIDLQTARLHIRHFEQSDSDGCWQLWRDAFKSEKPRHRLQSWLDWTLDSYRELAGLGQPPYADYAVELRTSREFIGAVGIVPTLVPWDALQGGTQHLLSPEVGLFWGILPRFQRQGYAREAGGALIDWLFDALALRQVVATTEYHNIASQNTMKALGMTLYRNPKSEPAWCQVVGKISNPRAAAGG